MFLMHINLDLHTQFTLLHILHIHNLYYSLPSNSYCYAPTTILKSYLYYFILITSHSIGIYNACFIYMNTFLCIPFVLLKNG